MLLTSAYTWVSQNGFYNLVAGGLYAAQIDQSNCPTFVTANAANSSVSLALSDDRSGVSQIYLRLAKAPDQYYIQVPR